MFLLPPSGFTPIATASPSSSVLFPLPFSPTKNVTRGWISALSNPRSPATENG